MRRKVPEQRCRLFPKQGSAPEHPPLPRNCAKGMSNQASAPTQHISLSPGRGDAQVKLEHCVFGMRRGRLPSCSRGLVTRL